MRIKELKVDCEDSFNIQLANEDDEVSLQRICNEWIEKSFFENDMLAYDHIRQCLLYGDLPPIKHATKENYALYAVRLGGEIVGLFDLYDGYPLDNTAWISLFLLDIPIRGRGFGQRIENEIACFCRANGFQSLALALSMNNRQAFKFWVSCGYKEILGLYGDIKFPVIGLKKSLK